MRAGTDNAAPAASLDDFLTTEDLRYLEQVSFVHQRRVRGVHSGLHHARLRGGTTEFAEHRAYAPGDEIRRLDWRVMGRSDRLEIKLYDDPSIFGTVILLDASGSMKFADSTRSKFNYGCAVTAWLSKLSLGQHDPVGLMLAGDEAPGFLWPKASTAHLAGVLHLLKSTEPAGPTRLAEQVRFLARNLRQPTRVVIVSDGFCDLDRLQSEIALLAGRRHRIHFLQTLAPEEISLDYRQPLRFLNLEGKNFVDANPLEIGEAYLEAMESHVATLRRLCAHHRGSYEPLVTDQPVGRSLATFIRRLSARKR